MGLTSASWPTGGLDPLLDALQQKYLPDLGSVDTGGLVNDPRLGRVAIVSSFGADSIVLLHVMSQLRPRLPVLFLETGMHFPETLAYVEEVTSQLDLDLIKIRPGEAELSQEDPNDDLWRDQPSGCCRLRKVFPLQDGLVPFDSWISGRKRFQASTRATVPILERDGSKIKVNPLALRSQDDIRRHIRAHNLPTHPLVASGYLSVGCAPCTRPVSEGEDLRAGRWTHVPDKTECGIHLNPNGKFNHD